MSPTLNVSRVGTQARQAGSIKSFCHVSGGKVGPAGSCDFSRAWKHGRRKDECPVFGSSGSPKAGPTHHQVCQRISSSALSPRPFLRRSPSLLHLWSFGGRVGMGGASPMMIFVDTTMAVAKKGTRAAEIPEKRVSVPPFRHAPPNQVHSPPTQQPLQHCADHLHTVAGTWHTSSMQSSGQK